VLQTLSIDPAPAWRELRSVCSTGLGIDRIAEGLEVVMGSLEDLTLLPLSTDPAAAELRAAATTARLIARSASLRVESRGVHHREDYPEPNHAFAGVRLRLARS
jgi:aspartate oxidase